MEVDNEFVRDTIVALKTVYWREIADALRDRPLCWQAGSQARKAAKDTRKLASHHAKSQYVKKHRADWCSASTCTAFEGNEPV